MRPRLTDDRSQEARLCLLAAAVGLGAMVGAGLMRTSGSVIDEMPFPWLVLALWAFGGVHVLLSANVASELVTSIPRTGGIFVPVRAAFGDSMGLLAGWVTYLSYRRGGRLLVDCLRRLPGDPAAVTCRLHRTCGLHVPSSPSLPFICWAYAKAAWPRPSAAV